VPGPAGTRFAVVRRFAEIDSTNRYLLDEARSGAFEGAVAVADHQSAGRGRLGRRWEAPAGSNLLVSMLLRPTLVVEELHLCTMAVALAAAAACEQAAGVRPDLKWPNDLMVGGRKLGGILAEALPAGALSAGARPEGPLPAGPLPAGAPAGRSDGSERTEASGVGPAVVVGLGLNVGWPSPDVDAHGAHEGALDVGAAPVAPETPSPGNDDLVHTATSIWRETGALPGPLVVLDLLLIELEARLVDLVDGAGRRRLTGEYRRRCATVGRRVRVFLPDEVFTGTAIDITVEGHLLVDLGRSLKTVIAGDVVHLRDPG
jgi:BirA family biotin operon repressor/biotin-[acetyl-CoA-carboxylase] ligase